GRGRIDAYQAVATALQAGTIRGEVRTTAAGSSPIAGAQISVYDEQNQRRAVVQTDEAGLYSVALPAGVYRLLVEAFAFAPQSQPDVALAFSETVSVDFFLDPLPLGTLEGEVRDAETNEPLSVQLLVQGTPVSTRSSAESGHYRLDLPTGLYALEARQNGYRRLVAEDLEVQAGQSTSHTLVLSPAPTLLLVDSGWWYYDSHGQTLAQALEDSDYVHDLWQVRTPTDAPALEDLLAYDAVVWSSPLDSPELIGAGDTISYYLGLGGNLLLTGQDVGFWESGRSGFVWHEYYGKLLQAELVSDDAGRGDLIGTPDSILSGLVLPVNGPDSDRNQVTPDSIQARDSRIAHLIGQYVSDGGGALQAEGCQSYRAVYLAAGLEGLGDRASRATVIERALDWLGRPHLATGVDLYPDHQEHVWEDGPDLTYRVGLRNLGQAADRFTLELSPSAWDTSLWDSTFETQIAESPVLAPCEWFTVGLKIQVPGDIPWNAGDVVTLTARSVSDPGHTAQATFSSKTPAPILLVDDQRWYDNSGRYRAALEANGLPYDLWSTRRPLAPDLAPSAQRLARYPLVVWFTGFDWYKTLTPEEEARLATYLDEGGRLLLSSQDYLYTSGFTPFARDYFGLAGYTENLSVTQFVGAGSSLLGQQVDPVALSYPFRNWSDALRPNPEGRIVAWGQHGQPVGLTLEHAPWKTAFFSFPLETMPQPELERLMAETVAWLSPLGDSVFTVDRATARPGEQLTYTLEIRNTGPRPLAGVSLSNTVPSGASYLDGSLQGPASYDPAERRIHWLGPLAAGQGLTVSYRVQLDAPLPAGGEISNVMDLGDESGLSLQRTALSRIGTPDLSASSKTVSAEKAFVGQVLIYTITLRNNGLEPAPAELVDPWPPYTLPLLGSAWA
ncbi:MAG: carboxypeptidase regulatory-like domain-containing protein, partial [Anaerolineae bacterium]